MKDRIIKFLSTENKTSAQFAEEIGVQPSGVSHILSGRNNPSLDFVLKMLGRYNYISPEWLLFGKLPMYRTNVNPTLFDMVETETPHEDDIKPEAEIKSGTSVQDSNITVMSDNTNPSVMSDKGKVLTRIVMFYSDRSFEEYKP